MNELNLITDIIALCRDRRVRVQVRVWEDIVEPGKYIADVHRTDVSGKHLWTIWDSQPTVLEALQTLKNDLERSIDLVS